jgi:hypothetical protein
MCFRRFWFRALALALAVAGVSCGGGPKLHTVKGTVKLDGEPVPGATVTFIPDTTKSSGGRQATGVTDDSGAFRLETFKPGDGAMAGEYKVAVQYGDPVTAAATMPAMKEGQSMKDAWEAAQKGQKELSKKKPKYVIPAKYSDPAKTILTQKVPADGPVNLDLQSK